MLKRNQPKQYVEKFLRDKWVKCVYHWHTLCWLLGGINSMICALKTKTSHYNNVLRARYFYSPLKITYNRILMVEYSYIYE